MISEPGTVINVVGENGEELGVEDAARRRGVGGRIETKQTRGRNIRERWILIQRLMFDTLKKLKEASVL